MAVISDIHAAPADAPDTRWHGPIRPSRNLDLFQQALARLPLAELDGLWLLGDLTDLGDVDSLRAVLDSAAGSGLSVRFVLGNHDVAGDVLLPATAPRVRPAGERAEAVGSRLRLAGLGVEPAAEPHAYRFTPTPVWADDFLVLLSHFPVFSMRAPVTSEGHRYAGDALGGCEITTALGRRSRPTVILHGHLHLRAARAEGRVLQLGFGALAEAGHELALVSLEVEPDEQALTVGIQTLALEPARPGVALSSVAPSWRFAADRWLPSTARLLA
ncbi:MAG: metallophosphoesterase [Chloroflexi bacterium]|nr:metallophosphoesterase [Chloroflexota bacterium]